MVLSAKKLLWTRMATSKLTNGARKNLTRKVIMEAKLRIRISIKIDRELMEVRKVKMLVVAAVLIEMTLLKT